MTPPKGPVCSVVIATFNRCTSLQRTLRSVLHQQMNDAYDVIIVDNGSTDDTATVMAAYCRDYPLLRYVREETRGPAAARNTGVSLSSAELIAFTDDDICPSPTWLRELVGAAATRPDVDCFGGRILPVWPSPPPAWLTREHWTGALALQDYGDRQFVIGRDRPVSLATANMVVRAQAFRALGGFAPSYLYAEDTELLVRMWRAGRTCLYVPEAAVAAEVQPERMRKAYHRHWHRRNAWWSACMRLDESFDGAGRLQASPVPAPTLFGAPAYMYRQLAMTAVGFVAATFRRKRGEAFSREKQLWQLGSYIRACAADPRRPGHHGRIVEAAALAAHLFRRTRSRRHAVDRF